MKPDLAYLMNGHRLNTVAISVAGNIGRAVVIAAMTGMPISPVSAQHVLDGVNALAETCYTLELIDIKTVQQEEGAHNGTLGTSTATTGDPG